jgi:ABC-2 type transport system permease protein
MTAETGSVAPAGLTPVSAWDRIYGFGGIYAKTIRDSRLAFLIVAGLLGGVMLAAGAAIPNVFSTPEARAEIVRLAEELGGAAQGLAGNPVNVGTLGGYIQWKYGPVFMLIVGVWSIMALSATLAVEARRGSLEFVAAAPFGKRRIALEKVAGHLTVLLIALAIFVVVTTFVGATFGSLPGDEIPLQAAFGFALWLGLLALAFGGLSFALSAFFGRGLAAGVGVILIVAGYIVSNYSAAVPAFETVALLTPWAWTGDHLPLAGQYDWASLVPVAIAAVVLLAVGVEAFVRRDIGTTSAVRLPATPGAILGQDGPIGRSFGERLPVALGWGIGLGLTMLFLAAASTSLQAAIEEAPDILEVIQTAFPGVDLMTAGGFLQLIFVELGFIVVGFAGVTLVSGWASDETSGRLEQILAAPVSRRSWVIRSGLGVMLAVAAMTLCLAVCIGLGAASAESDAVTPMVGTVVMGLHAVALVGIGVAVGGLWRASIAAEVVAVFVVFTYLIALLGPALKLPDWVQQLALTTHLGKPMIGVWDWVGMTLCVGLAVGGLLIGAWGMARRDLRG